MGRPRYSATVMLVEEPIVSMPERGKTVTSNVKSMFTLVLFIFSFLLTFLKLDIMSFFYKAKL